MQVVQDGQNAQISSPQTFSANDLVKQEADIEMEKQVKKMEDMKNVKNPNGQYGFESQNSERGLQTKNGRNQSLNGRGRMDSFTSSHRDSIFQQTQNVEVKVLGKRRLVTHIILPAFCGMIYFIVVLEILALNDLYYKGYAYFDTDTDQSYRTGIYFFEMVTCMHFKIFQGTFYYQFMYKHSKIKQSLFIYCICAGIYGVYTLPFIFYPQTLSGVWGYLVSIYYGANLVCFVVNLVHQRKFRMAIIVFIIYCLIQGIEWVMWEAYKYIYEDRELWLFFLLVFQAFVQKTAGILRLILKTYKIGGKSLLLEWTRLQQIKCLCLSSIFAITVPFEDPFYWMYLISLFVNQTYFLTGFHCVFHTAIYMLYVIADYMPERLRNKVVNMLTWIQGKLNVQRIVLKVQKLVDFILPKKEHDISQEKKIKLSSDWRQQLQFAQLTSLVMTFVRIIIYFIQKTYIHYFDFLNDFEGYKNKGYFVILIFIVFEVGFVLFIDKKYQLKLFRQIHSSYQFMVIVFFQVGLLVSVDAYLIDWQPLDL